MSSSTATPPLEEPKSQMQASSLNPSPDPVPAAESAPARADTSKATTVIESTTQDRGATNASSDPTAPEEPTAAAASAEAAPRKTRLLKDVEAEENKYIYDTLYRSLDDATDTSIHDELTVGDTVRQAREAKKEFLQATALPMKEKMAGCAALVRNLSEERNKKVAYVFVVYSVLILTLPLIMLMLGLHVIAPMWQLDATYCGGGMAVGTALVLVVSYVVYAVREDIADFKRKAEQEAEEKKKK